MGEMIVLMVSVSEETVRYETKKIPHAQLNVQGK